MSTAQQTRLPEILTKHEARILSEWLRQPGARTARQDERGLHEQSARFLRACRAALQRGGEHDVHDPAWADVRELLDDLSRSRAREGSTPSQTAEFVFSLKETLFTILREEVDADAFASEVWVTTRLLDGLGLYTTEVNQRTREELIARQHQDMLELSTPVVQIWEGILALPLIGTLDSARTQVVMESLLERIVEKSASIAIIDITGVPTVDTLVAQHLLKTVAAARLMGADCIISGIRPQIAQTIVHLGVELGDVITKATLADALAVALHRHGLTIAPARSDRE